MYNKQEWFDAGSQTETPLSAERLNHMENGIHEAHLSASASSGNVTVYVDEVNGDDANSGDSVANAVKTWERVRTMIPQRLSHLFEVRFVGSYSGGVTVTGLFIDRGRGGLLRLRGNTTDPFSHSMVSIGIWDCFGGMTSTFNTSIEVRYFRLSSVLLVRAAQVTVQNIAFRSLGRIMVNSGGSVYLYNSELGVSGSAPATGVHVMDGGSAVVYDTVTGHSNVTSFYAETGGRIHLTTSSTVQNFTTGDKKFGTVSGGSITIGNKGPVRTSPNGSTWLVTVSDTGELVTEAVS